MMFLIALNLATVLSHAKVYLGDVDASTSGYRMDLYKQRYNDLKVIEERINHAKSIMARLNGSDTGQEVRKHSKGLGTKYRNRSTVEVAGASSMMEDEDVVVKKNKMKPDMTSVVVEDSLKRTCPEGYSYYEDRCRKVFTYSMESTCDIGELRLDDQCVTRSMINYSCPEGFQRGKVVGSKTEKVLRSGDVCYRTAIDMPKLSCTIGFEMDRATFAVPTCKREYSQEMAMCSDGSQAVNGKCSKVVVVGRECPDTYFLDGEWCIMTYQEACPKTKKYFGNKDKTKYVEKKDKSTEREHAKEELFTLILSDAKSSGSLGDHVDKIFAEPKTRSMKQLEAVIEKKNQFWDGVVRAEKVVREDVQNPNHNIYVRSADAGYVDSTKAKKELKKIGYLEDNIWEHKIEYVVKETTTAVCQWEKIVPSYKVVQETPVPFKTTFNMVLETTDPDATCHVGYDVIAHHGRGKLCVKKESAVVIGSCDGVMKDGFCIHQEKVQERCPVGTELLDGECVRYSFSPLSWSWTVEYNCLGCSKFIKDKFRKEKVAAKDVRGKIGK